MRGDKFDRQGNALEPLEWARLLERPDYLWVAETTLPNGMWVSTVWTGLDHAFAMGRGPPIIFETIVFAREDARSEELDIERYATEAMALFGHEALCVKWRHREKPGEGGQ